MDSEWFAVKNFERFQHYKNRNPLWIKLYYSLLDDEDFLALDEVQQGRYMKLLLIASRQNNRVRHDGNYLAKVLRLSHKPDITPLFQAGFLLASRKHRASKSLAPCKQNACSEKRERREREESPKTPLPGRLSDEEFMTALRTNPAYAHVTLDAELGKMDAWLLTHPGRKKTRRFIVSWLNKIEPPVGGPAGNWQSIRDKFLGGEA